MFGAVKFTKNAEFDKYKYYGYGIWFDVRESFSLSDGSEFGKNIIIFGADMSLSGHVDNRKKYILILGKDPTQGLDKLILTAEKEYAINFSERDKKSFFKFAL